jgi:hypothetical protein
MPKMAKTRNFKLHNVESFENFKSYNPWPLVFLFLFLFSSSQLYTL